MWKVLLSACFISLASLAKGECDYSQTTSEVFTTYDATIVSQIGYIVEFTVNCDKTAYPNLFAEVEGKVIPLSKTGTKTYQMSWVEEVKKARSSSLDIRLFDEDGFTEIRKVQRANGDLSSVKPVTTIYVSTPGAYKGPWVNSELVAVGTSLFIAYFAFSARSKILA